MRSSWLLALGLMAAIGGAAPAAAPPLKHDSVVEASLDEVWAAFTTKEGIQEWMVPHAEIDLRVGGKMRTHYDPNGKLGDAKTIENTILSFDPKRMLSIKATKPPEGFPFPDAIKNMWSVIYFEELGPNRTKVTVVGLGYGDDEESKKLRAHFEAGNAYTLRKLQMRFAEKKEERK